MTAHLLDTNVLLRALQRKDPTLRACARSAIKRLHMAGDLLCVCPQNLIEFWNVCTRPTHVNGLGLPLSVAQRGVARCEAFFRLLPDTPEVFPEWKRLVASHQVTGLQVHDARLVAAMNVHGISSIVTFDSSDFGRYSHLTIIHPNLMQHP